jgi:hypothetical protein
MRPWITGVSIDLANMIIETQIANYLSLLILESSSKSVVARWKPITVCNIAGTTT